MTKIYVAPKEIKIPELDFSTSRDILKYKTECKTYLEELKDFLIKRNNGRYVGEVVKFPVADGYAEYMVANMKPLELVHIPLGDAYYFEYAHRLTANDIKEKIENQKKLSKIFGG